MLKNKTKITIFSLLILAVVGILYSFYFNNQQIKEINQITEWEHLFAAGACSSHDVFGWAYSPTIGPISLNCANCDLDGNGFVDIGDCGGDNLTTQVYNYGIDIALDGTLSGYAWSAGVGPISFNNAQICAHSPCEDSDFPSADQNSEFSAKVTWVENGKAKIQGWARALSACEFNGTNCGTNGIGDNTGGWDGWIKFDSDSGIAYNLHGTGDKYNTIIETVGAEHLIKGNAWGGVLEGEELETVPAAVIGEIVFLDSAKTAFDPNNVCYCEDPVAGFHAVCINGNKTSGDCYYTSGESILLDNDSVDPDTVSCAGGENIETSAWSPYSSCNGNGITNCSLDSSGFNDSESKTTGLTVTDYQANSDNISHTINFKKAIRADFSCCIPTDTVDCTENTHFENCNNYSTRIILEGATMYIKDNSSVSNYSIATIGTSINARSWTYDEGGETVLGALNELCKIQVTDDGIVEMTVTDTATLSDTKTLDFGDFSNIVSDPTFIEK